MNAVEPHRDRSLLIAGVVVGIIALVAIGVVLTRGEAPLRDASTPEGVVQRYATAVIAGDETEAARYLTDRAAERCESSDQGFSSNVRVTLVSTTVRDETADVRVVVVTSQPGGPFGGGGFEMEAMFDLVGGDGDWLIDMAPWPLSICPDGVGPK